MPTVVDLVSAFLDDIGVFFTVVFEWVGELLDFTSHPALLVLVIAMPIVGFAVGLLSRLIRA